MMKFDLAEMARVSVAIALIVTLFSVPKAHALDTGWGVHGSFESAQQTIAPGFFTDNHAFTLPSIREITSVAVSNNLRTFTRIPSGTVSHFGGSYGDAMADSLLASYSFSGSSGGSSYSVSSLTGSVYSHELSGAATGSFGSQCQFASAASPVPERKIYGMFLAGLVIVGFIASRRTRG